MLSYSFMRVAFFSAILISILLPLVGAPLVQKRLSNTGDAISHTSLAGVAIGLVCGFSTLWGAIIVSVIASLIIEFVRRRFQKYAELSLVIVMSFAVSLVAILSHFVGSGATFSSYMFGSITLITTNELITLIVLFLVVVLFYLAFYRHILYASYNELQASLGGVHVRVLNIVQTVLTSVIIAVASKTIGALMVSSMMVIPYAISLQLSKSYKGSLIVSIIAALISSILGMIISFYADLASGGTMVMVSVSLLVVSMILNGIFKFNR